MAGKEIYPLFLTCELPLKILIAGAGEIGFELSKVLSQEHHDVTVMDQNQNRINLVKESLDVMGIEGNATSPHSLIEAGASDADMMVAVTSIDEVNIIASVMAKRLGVRTVIARVRNDELSQPDTPINPSELGIDVLIHPEESAATEIHQLIRRTSASDVVSLADGRILLVGLRIEKESPVIGQTLAEFVKDNKETPFRIVAIYRRGTTIIPRGQNRLMAYDHLFILSKTDDMKRLIRATGHQEKTIRRVMIAGGTQLGWMLADKLGKDSQKWEVKLIEPNEQRATHLANEFRDILVLNGDPTDPDLLATEGIHETDAFISVTEDEESNIISCLMARHMKVKKTVALVSKSQYVPLSQTIGLDAVINVKAAASDEIHRQIRQGQLLTVKALKGIKAEIIEVIAGENCRMLDKPIHALNIPDGIVIGGILSNGSVEIATGNSIIRKGDRVITFTLPRAINRVEEIFK